MSRCDQAFGCTQVIHMICIGSHTQAHHFSKQHGWPKSSSLHTMFNHQLPGGGFAIMSQVLIHLKSLFLKLYIRQCFSSEMIANGYLHVCPRCYCSQILVYVYENVYVFAKLYISFVQHGMKLFYPVYLTVISGCLTQQF